MLATRRKLARLAILWRFIRPYKTRLAVLAVLSVVNGLLESLIIALAFPLLQSGLERAPGDRGVFVTLLNDMAGVLPVDDLFVANCVLLLILIGVTFLTRAGYVRLSVDTAAMMTQENKKKVFAKLAEADYQFYVDTKQGDLLYRTSQAPVHIASGASGLIKAWADILFMAIAFAMLISISWEGTLIVLVCGIGYFLFVRRLSLRISYIAGRGMRQADENEHVLVNEFITGVKQIRVSNVSNRWERLFHAAVNTRWSLWARNSFWTQTSPIILEKFVYAAIVAIVLGIRLYYSNTEFETMIPTFGVFALAGLRLLPRVQNTGSQMMQIANALPNLEAVSDLLQDRGYSRIRNGDRQFDGLREGIEFRDVTFAHKGRTATLHDISLTIAKDKVTAIVGPSGSGKSTIVDLVLRLYDVDHGTITIDNVDLREYDIATVRARIGFVGQETFIYNASVRDNITFGNEYPDSQVIEAAQLANAHDFIQTLPNGYDTIIGDRGLRLSGGEKQRIAIARAMIRKPEILILDEATSSLDNVSESIVQQAIDRVSESCTTLVVAHRLSTIRNAGTVYVLHAGRIIESGTHEDLLWRRGKYWELYRSADQEADEC